MRRTRRLPLTDLWDFTQFGLDAWTVMGLRMAKIAAGGPAAALEAQQMIAEKAAAAAEAQFAMSLALVKGATHRAAGRKAYAGYRRRVRANRRRLAAPS
jgi:hypothetical protein